MATVSIIRTRFHSQWLLLARVTWVAIAGTATGLLLLTLVTNTLLWWTGSDAACGTNAACLADNHAFLQVFGSFPAIGLYFGLGAAVEMLPWVLVGWLIFLRRWRDPFAWFFSLGLVLSGVFVFDGVVQAIVGHHFPLLDPLVVGLDFLANALLVSWFRFPNGKFVPRLMRWVAVVWVGIQFVGFYFSGSRIDVLALPDPLPLLIKTLFVFSLAAALVYRYRQVSGAIERQQIKWIVVTGAILATDKIAGLFVWPWVGQHPGLPDLIVRTTYLPFQYLSSALVAVGIGLAIFRYRLWDIDVIIRRTLVYSVLTALLALAYFSCVLVLAGLFRAVTGQGQNQSVMVISTLALAGLFVPLRRRVQSFIDRRFYRRKYDAARILAAFGAGARDQVELDLLSEQLLGVVDETMQPAHVEVWLRPDLGPVAAGGATAPRP